MRREHQAQKPGYVSVRVHRSSSVWITTVVPVTQARVEFAVQAFLSCFPTPHTNLSATRQGQRVNPSDAVEEGDVLHVQAVEGEPLRQAEERIWLKRCFHCGRKSPSAPCFRYSVLESPVWTCCKDCADHGRPHSGSMEVAFGPPRCDNVEDLVLSSHQLHETEFALAVLGRAQLSKLTEISLMAVAMCKLGRRVEAERLARQVLEAEHDQDVCCQRAHARAMARAYGVLRDVLSIRSSNMVLASTIADAAEYWLGASRETDTKQLLHTEDRSIHPVVGGAFIEFRQMSLPRMLSAPPRHLLPSNQFHFLIGGLDNARSGLPYWDGPCPVWCPTSPHVLAVSDSELAGVLLVDTEEGKRTAHWQVNHGQMNARLSAMCWLPKADGLLMAFDNGTIWSVGSAFSNLWMHDKEDFFCEQFALHGLLLASIWRDDRAQLLEFRIYSYDTQQCIFRCPLSNSCSRLCGCEWSSDGQWVAFHDAKSQFIWGRTTGMVEAIGPRGNMRYCGWHNDGSYLVVPSAVGSDLTIISPFRHHIVVYYRQGVFVYNMAAQRQLVKCIPPMQAGGDIWKVAVSEAGQMAVLFSNGELLIDRNVKAPDSVIPAADTFADRGVQVEQAVSHQAEPIDPDDICFDNKVESEEGTRGKVSFGRYRGMNVAVKAFDDHHIVNVNELYRLARMERHPNVITYIGHYSTNTLHLVLEWMPGGSDLQLFLRRKGAHLTEFKRAHIAKKIAEAIRWLHDRDLVHGDIRLENVVGDADFDSVKLIDMGCARPTRGHPELRAKGRHYKSGLNVRECDDIACFGKHVVDHIWKASNVASIVAPLVRSCAQSDALISSAITWLLAYQIHLLRHADFAACIEIPGAARKKVVLKQREGTFVWEDVVSLLGQEEARVLDSRDYVVVKLRKPYGTLNVLACLNPKNGQRHLQLEQECDQFTRYILPAVGAGRIPQCVNPCYQQICVYGPALCYMDTTHSAHDCTFTVTVDESTLYASVMSHPHVPEEAKLFSVIAARPRSPSGDFGLPWCLDAWDTRK